MNSAPSKETGEKQHSTLWQSSS